MFTILSTIYLFIGLGQAYAHNVNSSCECGISVHNRRVVGGTIVLPHQYPWLVSVMLRQRLHCGGSIITDLHILTAGHCNRKIHYHDLTVNVGMHDRLDATYKTIQVKSGVIHPNFSSNDIRDDNDVAILTLEKKLEFSDKVQPICLADTSIDYRKVPLTVAGWGQTRADAAPSRYLLKAKVGYVDSNQCKKAPIYRDNLDPDTMMCASSPGKDSWQGDSGGPLFLPLQRRHKKKWYQVGIVSWGIQCAMPGFPGVYSIVAKYISWIKQQTGDGTYCV